MIRELDRLERTPWDLIVIGGGIYGVCAAREAALRGLRACVLDRGDFGAATSSRSLRILHGGIRYLQHLDFARARESALERRRMLRIAPHLVAPLACVLPTRGHGAHGRVALAAALAVHDLVGFDRNDGLPPGQRIPRGRLLRLEELLRICPGLPAEGVTGGALWYDAQAWSTERLLLAFLASAVEAGAQAANHVEVERLLVRDRRVEGVAARDLLAGRTLEVRGRLVLNAAGPWIDEVLSKLPVAAPRVRFHPSKAFNLLVRPLLADHALAIPGQAAFRDEDAVLDAGSRSIFLVPWRGLTLVGTKHVRWSGRPEDLSISRDETLRLLAEVNAGYPPARLTLADVRAVQGGVLPEKNGAERGEVQLAKHPLLVDHARRDDIEGLMTVVGVKWTTARLVAAEVVDVVARKLGQGRSRRVAQDVPVAGGEIVDFERFLDEARRGRPPEIPAGSIEPLLRCHGTDAGRLIDDVRREPELGRPILDGYPVLAVQVVHAAREEMALHLDDVLLRRTDLWMAGADPVAVAERCAGLIAGPLGWDATRRRAEIDRGAEALLRGSAAPSPAR